MGSASAHDGGSSFCLGPEEGKRTCSQGGGASTTCNCAISFGAGACSKPVARVDDQPYGNDWPYGDNQPYGNDWPHRDGWAYGDDGAYVDA